MTVKRRCFFSFHYKEDAWRASQVRNAGVVEGDAPVSDNDWEEIKRGGDQSIKNWIDKQLKNKTCTIVLIGKDTANRKWVKHEIQRSWDLGKGVVGIHIHNLKNADGETSSKGSNPLASAKTKDGTTLSRIANTYNPSGATSTAVLARIKEKLNDWVEEAIKIRDDN